MHARPLVSLAAGALLLVGLTGCEKPTPGVTVSSGSHSVHVESATFCRDGQSAAKQDCVEHPTRVAVIRVKAGERVGFDVDKSVAQHGWYLVDVAARQTSGVQDGYYYAYTPQFASGPVVNLEVRSLSRPSPDAETTGVWKVQLVQE